jgi:hypothetical protein
MVRLAYPGIPNPTVEFEKLEPLVAELRRLQQQCKPFGRDYHALALAIEGLDTAVYHFTRQPRFFGDGGAHK